MKGITATYHNNHTSMNHTTTSRKNLNNNQRNRNMKLCTTIHRKNVDVGAVHNRSITMMTIVLLPLLLLLLVASCTMKTPNSIIILTATHAFSGVLPPQQYPLAMRRSKLLTTTIQHQQQQQQNAFLKTGSTKGRSSSLPSSSSSVIPLQLSVLNWDDIVYQTESLGNAMATFSFQQLTSSNPDPITDSIISSSSSAMNQNHNSMILTAFPIMYIAGLFTSFSPCVWGLLPLTISYISTAANERRDQQTILPTIAFASGLATVFCTMGMIAVNIGTVFGTTATTPPTGSTDYSSTTIAVWTTLLLPILSNFICFIMGLKLLDLVNIPLPSFNFLASVPSSFSNVFGIKAATETANTGVAGPILLDATGRTIPTSTAGSSSTAILNDTQSSDSSQLDQDEGNALIRTFLLGGSSALVASPCATPVLTSILAYVANTMSSSTLDVESTNLQLVTTITGAFLLFGYTLGYSTPLLLVAATSGQALVRIKQQQQKQQHGDDKNFVLKSNMMNKTDNTTDTDPASSLSVQGQFQSLLYNIPNIIAPWVTPITGGILLYLGTSGLLLHTIGDPSLIGLTIIE